MTLWLCMSSVTHSRSVLRSCLVASAAPAPTTTTSADFSLRQSRRPFRHKARSPQVRTHTFIAQPPHLRHLALVTRASWGIAHSPCLATPSIRFLFIGSRFTLHASFPRSVTLTQLRFTLLTVTSSQRDLRPQVCAHAGRTTTTGPEGPVVLCKTADYFKALKRTRLGLAPSSPRRRFLSASYSW
jgi:hypothetical protein